MLVPDIVVLSLAMWVLARVNTHSDPDESPSTVPALMLMATPFSWSGRLGLAEPARPSLEEDPRGDAVPGVLSQSSLWMRLKPFLSTIGESCFFFRIPAQEENMKSVMAFLIYKLAICCLLQVFSVDYTLPLWGWALRFGRLGSSTVMASCDRLSDDARASRPRLCSWLARASGLSLSVPASSLSLTAAA